MSDLSRAMHGLANLLTALFAGKRAHQVEVQKRLQEDTPRWPEILTPPAPEEDNPTHLDPAPEPEVAKPTLELNNPQVRPDSLKALVPDAYSTSDLEALARKLGVEPAVIKAVVRVEAFMGRGFDKTTNQPIILVEYSQFSRLTQGRFDNTNPDVSNPKWKAIPYPKDQATRWAHLYEMWELDPNAAYQATSFGLFQVMGFNFGLCGCKSVFEFVTRMASSEASQLTLWGELLTRMKDEHGTFLAQHLYDKNWYGWAIYNGTGQRETYARLTEQAYNAEIALLQKTQSAAAGMTSRVIPLHSARCLRTTQPTIPPQPCTCGNDGAAQGAPP